jgi:hypothetical protein
MFVSLNMMCFMRVLCSCFFLYLFVVVSATDLCKESNYAFTAKMHSGFILPHHKSITYITDGYMPGFEMAYSKNLYKNTNYANLYRYPKLGLGYFYTQLKQNDILGNAHALFPFMTIPVFREKKRIELNYTIGFGLSYLTKYFDLQQNVLNIAIGTPLNIYYNFRLEGQTQVLKNLSLSTGVSIIHFSNGNIRKPNLGLNYISGLVGLNYILNSVEPRFDKPEDYFIDDKWNYTFIYSAGVRTYNLLMNENFFASSFALDANYVLNQKRELSLGADVFYSEVIRNYLLSDSVFSIGNKDLYQVGLHAGHNLVYNRLTLVIQAGAYIYASYKERNIYSRFGLRYLLTDYLLFNLSLKTHLGSADFVEFGVGLKL